MNTFIHARDVGKRFGKTSVLQGLDLKIDRPGVTVLLGANGAGKSTLLRALVGLVRPESGTISVLGLNPIKNQRKVCQAVGYVPDAPDAPGWMTANDLFNYLAPQYPTWNPGLVERLSERCALPRATPLRRMSRGEGAKAMVIAALAFEPRLLLMDEALSGLDPLVKNEVLGSFLGEFRAEDCAALVATHDLDVAARIADRVIVLDRGRIQVHDDLERVVGGEAKGRRSARLFEVLEQQVGSSAA